jgi:biotin carboxylase
MVSQRQRILLISEPNGYRLAPYIAAAKKMDLDTLVASCGRFSLTSEVVDGLHVDLNNTESSLNTILNHAKKKPFAGVIGCDDSTVELAAIVARELGLTHNSPAAARLTRRKDLARSHLGKFGCRVPRHWLINLREPLEEQLKQVDFPCVLKPLALSASRGVIRANSAQEFIEACKRIAQILEATENPVERNHLLAESYIDGIEIAFEGFLDNGKLTTLAIFDKPDPLIGPYFEETIYVMPSKLDRRQHRQVIEEITKACQAYDLTTGPIHAELRIDHSSAWILEVAARTIGGDCARSLDDDSFNLEELIVSLAIGKQYDLSLPVEARGVMMIPIPKRGVLRRVEGLSEAIKIPHIENIEITTRSGNELIPLPEGNQYPGFIFARAETSDEVVTALRAAHEKLNFVVSPIITTRIR